VEQARTAVADPIGADPREIVWTSGSNCLSYQFAKNQTTTVNVSASTAQKIGQVLTAQVLKVLL